MSVKSELTTARSGRLIVLLIAALTAALYLRSMARGVLPGDPGEFQMAAWNFGVAHATGYPLYLIFGGLWQHFWHLFGISPAASLNALSALIGVLCVVFFYWVTAAWLQGPLAFRRAAAALSAAWLAANPTFWSQALIAEVYTLHALFLVLILGALQRIDAADDRSATPVWLFLLLGLSLAHHATTVLYLPGVALFLWFTRRQLTRSAAKWLLAAVLLLAPLLLYLYVPLRATPAASPWYFPRIGEETFNLFPGGVGGFLSFLTGRSISVGFRSPGGALAAVPEAFHLWTLHFGWVGFVLVCVGIYGMVRRKLWSLLAFTVVTAVCLQLFNLFYAIGDILVYYIPLYVIASLWLGFGAFQLGTGFAAFAGETTAEKSRSSIDWRLVGLVVVLGMIYLPVRQVLTYARNLDQSASSRVGQMWDGILAADLAPGSILVSNDRNEVVPLYYAQYVDGVRRDITGLFPLIEPGARFADVAATVQTALDSGAPVYLTKPMPGLDVRFKLAAQPPVVQVLGSAANEPNSIVDQPYGPLTLLGIDWSAAGNAASVRLHWLVSQQVPGQYTTTVQLFDAAGNKIGQNDAVAGGQYYPTQLWKPGESIVEEHAMTIETDRKPASLLVAMYTGADMAQLAPPIMIALESGLD